VTDPTRIREPGSDVPPELRDLFRTAAKPEPLTPVIDASLSARIGAIAAQPPASLLKLLPWLGGGAVLVGAAVLVSTSAGVTPSSTQTPPIGTAVRPVTPAPPQAATPVQPPVEVPAPAQVAPLPDKPSPHASSVPSGAEDALAGEARLLNEAHSVIAANPRQALTIAQEHARRYPRGQLAAERELILVQALVKLGRKREAEVRGRELQKTAPSGIYRDRLDTILQEK